MNDAERFAQGIARLFANATYRRARVRKNVVTLTVGSTQQKESSRKDIADYEQAPPRGTPGNDSEAEYGR